MALIKKQEQKPLTVERIQRALYGHFYGRFDLMATNAFIGTNECDFVGVRKSGFIDEFEIKLSRADFKADFKKETLTVRLDDGDIFSANATRNMAKHDALPLGLTRANYFYFAVPDGLVLESEVPKHCGLIYFTPTGCPRVVREAPKLHKRKITDALRLKLAMKLHYRWWDSFIDKMNSQEMNEWLGDTANSDEHGAINYEDDHQWQLSQ